MAKMKFYDVKTRQPVETEVTGKKEFDVNGQKRYAVVGKTDDGRNLTKFVSKDTYEGLADVPKVPTAKKS